MDLTKTFSKRHTAELAQAVVDVGAVPLLVLCVQVIFPELILIKRINCLGAGNSFEKNLC